MLSYVANGGIKLILERLRTQGFSSFLNNSSALGISRDALNFAIGSSSATESRRLYSAWSSSLLVCSSLNSFISFAVGILA